MYFSGISHIFCCWALLIPPQLFTAFACDSPHLVLALAVVKDRHFRVQVYLSETCHHWTVLLISSVWSQVLWAELCDLVSGLYLSYISMRKVTGFPFPYIVAFDQLPGREGKMLIRKAISHQRPNSSSLLLH